MEVVAKMKLLDNEYNGVLYCCDNYSEDGTIDINFEGHYLIQFKDNGDGDFKPTGNAIDGWCNPVPKDLIDSMNFNICVLDRHQGNPR